MNKETDVGHRVKTGMFLVVCGLLCVVPCAVPVPCADPQPVAGLAHDHALHADCCAAMKQGRVSGTVTISANITTSHDFTVQHQSLITDITLNNGHFHDGCVAHVKV